MKTAGFAIDKTLTVSHYRVGFLKRTIPTAILAGWTAPCNGGLVHAIHPSVFVRSRAIGGGEQLKSEGFFAARLAVPP
jgi:hypothetical protein